MKERITIPKRDSKSKAGDADDELEQRFAEIEKRVAAIEQRFEELDDITQTKNNVNAEFNEELMKRSNEMQNTLSNIMLHFDDLKRKLPFRTV